jgi:hypothetical protein
MGEVVEPTILPDGWYRFTITGYNVEQVGKNQTGKITMFIKPTQVVDAECTDEALANTKRASLEFWVSEKAISLPNPARGILAFLQNGLNLPQEVPPKEALELTIGLEFEGRTKEEMVGKDKDYPQAQVIAVRAA